MKLPFDLATKLLFRMIFPGVVMTAILWPAMVALTDLLSINASDAVLGTLAIVTFGWLILLLDGPIFMLFTGRRYWLKWLRKLYLAAEKRRLQKLIELHKKTTTDAEIRFEASLRLREFPLDSKTGEWAVRYPTRIGNLLEAAESYPLCKYGLEGPFTWPRLWSSIDNDLRTELDNQQALVDSPLYLSLVLVFGIICCLTYAAISWCGVSAFSMLPHWTAMLGLAALCLFGAWFFYRLAVAAQLTYGELFAAVYDQHRNLLNFDPLLAELSDSISDLDIAIVSPRMRNRAAIRFLKWHRVRLKEQSQNAIVEEW